MPSGQAKKALVPGRKVALCLLSKIKISGEMFKDFVHGESRTLLAPPRARRQLEVGFPD